MALVAGVDSSTQSCKIVIRDADTGAMVRSGRAPHPDGTEVDPAAWESALRQAIEQAGGLGDVAALAVGGQQHGMVALDSDGVVIRPALLWNDTRSARAAAELVAELGDGDTAAGMAAWAQAIGSVPVASLTVTKLRWLAEHEPENAARVAAVALPHDWLTWRLAQSLGAPATLDTLVTDRSDASGTGYWSPFTEDYRRDLLVRGLGHDAALPAVLGPRTAAPFPTGITFGPGAGDNAAAALGLGLGVGDVAVSIGTSGVVSAICPVPVADPSGMVTGFADATGAYLPLACTLNASRIVDHVAGLLGVGYRDFDELAMSAEPGAGGVALVPYFDGERTPDRPTATASFHGLTAETTTRAAVARAAVEGLLCSLADGMTALRRVGVPVERVFLLGGGAKSIAVRTIAPAVLGQEVLVPAAGEYVADGAARQAAWVLSGAAEPPAWSLGEVLRFTADPTPWVLDRYAEARDLGQLARG